MKKVVILGGGFAGSQCAKKLEKHFDVTLIDEKEYFEYTPSILELAREPERKRRIQIPHTSYLKKARFLKGKVQQLREKEVTVNNQSMLFDYAIIATGAKYRDLFVEAYPAGEGNVILRAEEELAQAKEISILGGGIVGVELAGELVTKYKDKNITIIQSKDRLLERSPEKASRYAQKWLTKKGVKILFNERVKAYENNVFVTENGTKIPGDLAFSCIGIALSAQFAQSLGILNERGAIEVNEFLQTSIPHIFAAGDITSIKEEKMAHAAEHHAKIIVKNIKALEKQKHLTPYKPGFPMMLISLGPRNAIFILGQKVFTGFIPAIMKWGVEVKTLIKY